MMTDMRGFIAIFGNVGAADRLDFTMIEIGANLADFLAGTERKSGWLKDSGSHLLFDKVQKFARGS